MAELAIAFGPVVIELVLSYIVKPILKNFSITARKFKKRLEEATSELDDFLTVKEFAVYLAKYLNRPSIEKITKEENIEEIFSGILHEKFKSQDFQKAIKELMEIFNTGVYYFYLMKVDEILNFSFFKSLFLPANPSLWDESFIREISKTVRISIASLATKEKREDYKEDYWKDEKNIYKEFLDILGRINLLGYRLWIKADDQNKMDFESELSNAEDFLYKYRGTLKKDKKIKNQLSKIEKLLKLFQKYAWGKIELIKIKDKMDLNVSENNASKYKTIRNKNRTYRESYEQIIRNLNEDFISL